MSRARTGEPSELDLLAIACLLPSLLYVLAFRLPVPLRHLHERPPLKVSGLACDYIAFFTDHTSTRPWGSPSPRRPNTIVVVASACLRLQHAPGIAMERTITTSWSSPSHSA